MNRKLISSLVAVGLLAIGIGVSGALAGDDNPTQPPVACSVLAPGGDTNDAAKAVGNAADNVSEEADSQQADDQEGDVNEPEGQNNDQGEQGDCNDVDDGDQGDGDH
jgi:hypothetical protein